MKNRTFKSLLFCLGLIGSASTNLWAGGNQSIESITSDLERHTQAMYQADMCTKGIPDLGTLLKSLMAISNIELPTRLPCDRSKLTALRFAIKELLDFYPFRLDFLPIGRVIGCTNIINQVRSVLDGSENQRLSEILQNQAVLLNELKIDTPHG